MKSETNIFTSEDNDKKDEMTSNNPAAEFHLNEMPWREVGFWSAIHNPESPESAYNNLYSKHETFHQKREEILKDNHLFEIQRFNEKIGNAKTKIEELEHKLAGDKDTSAIVPEIEELKAKIQELEEKLIVLYKTLGNEKKNIIQDQIDETFADLEKITDKYKKVAEDYNELSKKIQNENSDVLNVKPEFLKHLRDSYQDIHNQIKNRLENLSLSGVSYVIRPQLLGYASAFAAGWFFSVFALKKDINNQDTPFFLLTGLFSFGSKLKTDNFYTSLLQHTVFVLVCLLLVFFVTWLCQIWIERKGETSIDEVDLNGEPLAKSNLQIPTKALLSFWVQNIPFLLVLGIVFIVLSLGNDSGENLQKLNTSLSAQTVGLFIALGFGGLTYIYIINVIEPRLEEKRKNNLPVSWLRANIELACILIFILLTLIVLLLGVENTLYQYSANTFSFAMFITCILLSSFAVGYGIYYTGLVDTVKYVEKEMEILSIKTAYSSFPDVRLIINSDRNFRKMYSDLILRLLRLLDYKTKVAEKFFYSDNNNQNQQKKNNKHNEKTQNNFWKFLNNLFSSKSSQENFDEDKLDEEIARIEERFETLFEDKEYFPQLTCEIENLKGRISGEIRRLAELEKTLRDRQEEKTDYALKLNKEITELRERIYNWEKHITSLRESQLVEFENLYNKYRQETMQMQDGFNLALWFLAYNIKPTPHSEVIF